MPDEELNIPRGANNPRPRAVPTAKVVDPSVAWFNTRVAVSPLAFGSRDRETFAVRVLYTTAPDLRDDIATVDKCHARLIDKVRNTEFAAVREYERADEQPIFAKRSWCHPIPEKLTGLPGFWMRDVCLPNDLVPPKFGTSGTYFRISSSSESFPCCASSTIADAVNCFATDPLSNTDAAVIGTPYSRFADP